MFSFFVKKTRKSCRSPQEKISTCIVKLLLAVKSTEALNPAVIIIIINRYTDNTCTWCTQQYMHMYMYQIIIFFNIYVCVHMKLHIHILIIYMHTWHMYYTYHTSYMYTYMYIYYTCIYYILLIGGIIYYILYCRGGTNNLTKMGTLT